jgi:hypothetical protein
MCACCQNARISPGYAVHCPTCAYCGARLIQNIQCLPINRESKVARCRQVLSDWIKHGHSEAEIRRMAKLDAAPLEPMETTKGKKNDR